MESEFLRNNQILFNFGTTREDIRGYRNIMQPPVKVLRQKAQKQTLT